MPLKKQQIREKILELSGARGSDKTICPSEVARVLSPDHWRDYMESVRAVACELHVEGQVEITQKGKKVKDLKFTGPIRIKICKS